MIAIIRKKTCNFVTQKENHKNEKIYSYNVFSNYISFMFTSI